MKAVFINFNDCLNKPLTKDTELNLGTRLKINPKLFSIVKQCSEGAYIICVLADKPDLSRNKTSIKLFSIILSNLCEDIEKHLHLPIGSIHFRFSSERNSYYARPSCGMAYDLAIDLELSLKDCLIVSNDTKDKEFAQNAGIGTFLYFDDFL